jgi:hypothetical protein
MMAFGVWMSISNMASERKHQKSRDGAALKERPRLAGYGKGDLEISDSHFTVMELSQGKELDMMIHESIFQ